MPTCADFVASGLLSVAFILQACAIDAMRMLSVASCVPGVVRMRREDLSSSIPTYVFSVFGSVMLALRVDVATARCLCFRSILLFLSVRLIRICVMIASKLPELKTFACAVFSILAIVDKVRGRFVLRVSSIVAVRLTYTSFLWPTVAGVM